MSPSPTQGNAGRARARWDSGDGAGGGWAENVGNSPAPNSGKDAEGGGTD